MTRTPTWRTYAKSAAALTAFGALHSLLAYRGTKQQIEAVIGEKPYRAYYRLFYNAQAIVSTFTLFRYILRQPDQDLYEVKGPPKYLMHLGQIAAGLYCTWAVINYGLARFIGITDALSWTGTGADSARSLSPRESQGPTMDESGRLITDGAFRWSRHPLNVSAFIAYWLMPRMTINRWICGLFGSAYLIAGSLHEEKRLDEDYGETYERYRSGGTPFFLPFSLSKPEQADA